MSYEVWGEPDEMQECQDCIAATKDYAELKKITDNLSALVVRLSNALKKRDPSNDLPALAMDYVKRNGFNLNVLREDAGAKEMSEQKHTKGPWGIEKTTKTLWIGPLRNDGKIADITCSVDWCDEYHNYAKERNEANARRIVACVNALEGVSTADLEQYGDAFADGYISVAEREKLQARVKELEAQRDELLSTLKDAVDRIESGEPNQIRELIAKIEAERVKTD